MALNIVKPDSTRAIVEEDSTMHYIFRDWSNFITDQVNFSSMLSGVGSPEGVVVSKRFREYMDETGTTGNIKYIKQVNDIAGDESKGWILI